MFALRSKAAGIGFGGFRRRIKRHLVCKHEELHINFRMRNKTIAQIFNNIATFMEMKEENVFKIKAYRKAAENIESLAEDIADIKRGGRLSTIPGIGKALEEKIGEFLDTGKVKVYEELKEEIPETLLQLTEIPKVGPKTAKLLFDQLKIKDVDGLKKAAEQGKLSNLPGIKEKTVDNILQGISLFKEGKERMNLGIATRTAEGVIQALKKLPQVKRISTAGSLRRMKETIRDIDILIDSPYPQSVMDAFVSLPQVKQINSHGETKSSILTEDNVQVDVRVVDSESFGAALLYFTGSKSFNIRLRQVAIKKKMKVSEYGVFSIRGDKEEFLAGKTEEDCFKTLGLPFVPPELREEIGEDRIFSMKNTGARRALPQLIGIADVQGDLHVHSTYSDGRNSIEEMALAAQNRGYSYIAISDHSPGLRVAGGVSVANLRKKKDEIDRLNNRFKNFRVLFGTEVEIDLDGNLDYNDAVLKMFDVVIAAIHSGFTQGKERLTERLLRAITHKHVHVIAHPTGIHLGKRDPYEIDFQKICRAARDHNTFLEVNAFPIRLDLNSSNVSFARQQGVRFSVNTDAHAVDHLDYMRFGIAVARRGWLEKKDVLNTYSAKELLEILKK